MSLHRIKRYDPDAPPKIKEVTPGPSRMELETERDLWKNYALFLSWIHVINANTMRSDQQARHLQILEKLLSIMQSTEVELKQLSRIDQDRLIGDMGITIDDVKKRIANVSVTNQAV